MAWEKDKLKQIAEADDLHISPSEKTARPTVPQPGSGPSLLTGVSMPADTTARSPGGIKRRYGRRRAA
jgi:hypothetical protein